jgi:hypothetical protein
MNHIRVLGALLFSFAMAALPGCGGGGGGNSNNGNGGDGGNGGSPPPPPLTFTIGGNVSGLAGTLILQNNAGDDLILQGGAAPLAFTFSSEMAAGRAYAVTIRTQPDRQECVVENDHGVANGNVTDVTVSCSSVFSVGGTVNGLRGTVVLQNNGVELPITRTGLFAGLGSSAAQFAFREFLAAGSQYDVTIKTQPADQVCKLASDGAGTIDNADVADIVITCATHLSVRSADFTVPPGQELVFCYYFDFPNVETVQIQSIRSLQPATVQQATVFVLPARQLEPGTILDIPCGFEFNPVAFHPLYATRFQADGADHSLTFPADDGSGKPLGYALDTRQPAALQLHLINPDPPERGARIVHVDFDVTLHTQGLEVTPVGVYAISNNTIDIPSGSERNPVTAEFGGSCLVTLPSDPAPPTFFDMRLMTHSHGTLTSIKDGTTVLLENAGWSNPAALHVAAPPYPAFTTGHVDYQCKYINPTNARIEAGGDPRNEEACMMVAYYFPLAAGTRGALCLNNARIF